MKKRELPELWHEVVHPEGGSVTLKCSDDWQATERASGGYDGWAESVPPRIIRRNRGVFRAGAEVRTRTEDGELVWSGHLKDNPAFSEGVGRISADGLARMLERSIGRYLLQTAEMGEWKIGADDEAQYPDRGVILDAWDANVSGVIQVDRAVRAVENTKVARLQSNAATWIYFYAPHVPGGLQRLRFTLDITGEHASDSAWPNTPGGGSEAGLPAAIAVDYSIPTVVIEAGYYDARGQYGDPGVFYEHEVMIWEPDMSGTVGEQEFEFVGNPFDLSLFRKVTASAIAGSTIDPTHKHPFANLIARGSPDSFVGTVTNVGGRCFDAIPLNGRVVNRILIRVHGDTIGDLGANGESDDPRTHVSLTFRDVVVNGIAPGDRYSAASVYRDMANMARIEARDIQGGAINILPFDFTGSAAEVCEQMDLLTGMRHLVLETDGGTPYLDVGRWAKRVWTVPDRQQSVDFLPLPRFDRLAMPYRRNDGTRGVIHIVHERPFSLPRPYGRVDLQTRPSSEAGARRLGEALLDDLHGKRYAGGGLIGWVEDRDGELQHAYGVHAGDVLRKGRKHARMRGVTKSRAGVQVVFDEDFAPATRLAERRAKRVEAAARF